LDEFEKYIIVFIAGVSGIWKGIPVGIGLNLSPLYIGLVTALGSITTVLILFFAGEAFRKWILKFYGAKRIERKAGKFVKFANHYGPWGLGLITAGILGPITSMLLGLIFFSNRKKFVIILITGILIWSIILALIFDELYALVSGLGIFTKSI